MMTAITKTLRPVLAGAASLLAMCGVHAGEVIGLNQADAIRNQYIVVFKDEVLKSQSVGQFPIAVTVAEVAAIYGGKVKRTYEHALQGAVVTMDEEGAKRLANDPRVAYVEVDAIFRLQSVVSDVVVQSVPGWGLDRIDQHRLPRDDRYVYPASAGRGVHAYVIDGAILESHPEFTNRLGDGVDVVGDGGPPPLPWPPVYTLPNESCYGHGTAVASVLGGTQVGVAKLVTIHPVRVMGCEESTPASTVIAGIDWVIAHHAKPAVANLSFSGPSTQSVRDAVNRLINAGVSVVTAAGNDARDACSYTPANVPNAITVAASVMADDQLWSYSNYGPCVDLKAPGSQVSTANAGDIFEGDGSGLLGALQSGTSFAAPYVAGAAALLLSKYPAAMPAEVSVALIANMGETGVLRTSFLLTNGTPTTPTSFATRSNGCFGDNTMSWDSMVGTTRYEVWASTRSTFANAWLVGQYPDTQAIGDFPTITYLHVRACNWWGCSGFSSPKASKLTTSCG